MVETIGYEGVLMPSCLNFSFAGLKAGSSFIVG
jgi:hypothetical protein